MMSQMMVTGDSWRYQEISGDIRRYQEIPSDSGDSQLRLLDILGDISYIYIYIRRYLEISRDSFRFLETYGDSWRFPKIPQYS